MPGSAGLAYYKWYQCCCGEILSHFNVKNIFLAQKLTKLQYFKENPSKNCYKISQNEQIKIKNVKCSWYVTFQCRTYHLLTDNISCIITLK